MKQPIRCGARSSLLSRAQVKEVQAELPFALEPVWVETSGDLDQKTSLRDLDKTDFFTREIDQLLLQKEIRLAIHSAKDLPAALPKGLCVAALTQGKDPRDSLVFLRPLPKAPRIATSSFRREENVKKLFPEATFIDIRGSIHERLKVLQSDAADGVVIAEAALIRLELTDLPRLFLPGDTAPLQGQLALVVREEDEELRRCLDNVVNLRAPPLKPAKGTSSLGTLFS